MKGMLVAVVCLVAGVSVGATFEPKRGLTDAETVVAAGKTNVIAAANLAALRAMTPPERVAQWAYLDAEMARLAPGTGVETRRAFFNDFMQGGWSDGWTQFGPRVALGIGSGTRLNALGMASVVRMLAACEPMPVAFVTTFKERVKAYGISLARRKMFAAGVPFTVGKDGKNPLEATVGPVVTALNAPGCRGLVEAFGGLGADLTDGGLLPAFQTPDAAQLETMTADAQAAVVAADNPTRQGQLLLLLGVDGYNAFVKRFNEGK